MAKYKSLTAEQFLNYFEGTIFQTFYDPDSTKEKTPWFTTYNPQELKKLNDQKYGVYFSINAFKDRRVKENLIKLNAAYGDLDLGKENDGQPPEDVLIKKREVFKKLSELPITPNIITVTKNGLQPIFLIENPGIDKDTQDIYTSTVCGLTTWSVELGCRGDAVKDVSRVLRIPGYYHQKGEPAMVKSFLLHETKTTLKELSKLFPYFDERKIKNDNAAPDSQSSELDKLSMKEIALAALREYGEPNAYFDDKGRIWLKRGVTGAFLGKLDNCDYIGSNSHELPYGNKITFVRELLKLPDNKAAFRWIAQHFQILSKPQESKTYIQLTDTSNAEFINRLFGDKVRFDHKRKRWLVWTDHRWQPDTDGSIRRLAIEAARIRYHEASSVSNLELRSKTAKWAVGSEAKTKLDAAVDIAKVLKPIADSGDGWDSDPMLLCCPNGVLDLRTGELRAGTPEDRLTMSINTKFDPTATCPRWIQFLNEIFQSDEGLISYIQKVLGYSITGSVKEQIVLIVFGPGANGKTVFFSTIRSVLGEYAHNAPATLFQRNAMATQSNDLAATEFKRFLMCSEVLTTTKLNEQRIKQMSGGDPITARYLYSEYFEFMPTAKIWLFVNHKPQVEDDSHGFWRRVRLIPFSKVFTEEEQDKNLPNKLLAEASGILNWLLEGCLKWQREGLNPTPQAITAATKEYRVENDVLADFLYDFTADNSEDKIQALMFYQAYQKWCEEKKLVGKSVLSQTLFGIKMGDKFQKTPINGRVYYVGLRLFVEGVDSLTPFSIKYSKKNLHEEFNENDPKPSTQAQQPSTNLLSADKEEKPKNYEEVLKNADWLNS